MFRFIKMHVLCREGRTIICQNWPHDCRIPGLASLELFKIYTLETARRVLQTCHKSVSERQVTRYKHTKSCSQRDKGREVQWQIKTLAEKRLRFIWVFFCHLHTRTRYMTAALETLPPLHLETNSGSGPLQSVLQLNLAQQPATLARPLRQSVFSTKNTSKNLCQGHSLGLGCGGKFGTHGSKITKDCNPAGHAFEVPTKSKRRSLKITRV